MWLQATESLLIPTEVLISLHVTWSLRFYISWQPIKDCLVPWSSTEIAFSHPLFFAVNNNGNRSDYEADNRPRVFHKCTAFQSDGRKKKEKKKSSAALWILCQSVTCTGQQMATGAWVLRAQVHPPYFALQWASETLQRTAGDYTASVLFDAQRDVSPRCAAAVSAFQKFSWCPSVVALASRRPGWLLTHHKDNKAMSRFIWRHCTTLVFHQHCEELL